MRRILASRPRISEKVWLLLILPLLWLALLAGGHEQDGQTKEPPTYTIEKAAR